MGISRYLTHTMLGCYFMASGTFFDVDSFLETCDFEADAVFYRGEPMIIPKGQPRPTSGFSRDICHTRTFGDLAVQVPRAIEYLRDSRAEIKRLQAWPGVKDLRLVFPFSTGEFAVAAAYLPPELVSLAGELGVGLELSVYPGGAPSDDDVDESTQPDAPPNGGHR